MKKFKQIFQLIVDKIEGVDLPIHRYLFLFIAILSVRLCLEFFSNQRLFKAEDVLHISLWFIFIVEAFMLQLHLFSKEKVDKIIRLVVCCFSIALTAPIIDLIVSQGKMSKMNYLAINSGSDLLWSYITIGGASLSRGATLGIRIEIVLLIFASFNYIFAKTNSIWRSLIGTFSIYTVLFLSGAIPFFMSKINLLFGLTYSPNDQSSIYLLFLLDLLIFLVLIYRLKANTNKKKFDLKTFSIAFIRISVYLCLLIYGIVLARINYAPNWTLNPTTIYYFPLLVLLFTLIVFNELWGKNGRFSGRTFNRQTGLFVLIVFISSCINFYTFFGSMICWGILFFLYESPLNFSKIKVLSALFKSLLNIGFVFLGFLTFGAPLVGFPTKELFLILIVSFLVYLYFDFKTTTTAS
ncbi:MAG: hypothetical protein ACK479_02690 [Fluviicola sp.]|jgi:hypothetical protein